MAASQEKLTLIIEAQNNATAAINAVKQSVNDLNGYIQTNKERIQDAGKVAGVAFAAIGFAVKKSMDVFIDFEHTMSAVNAVLSPTAAEFENLTNKARQLGRDTGYSAVEAAGAMEMLAKNGLNTAQIMDGAIDSTLNLAAATGSNLSTAADIATSAMLSFGLQTGDLAQVVDSITGTTNASKFSIDDYALALAQGGGVAKTVGVSFKDFNTTVAAISPLFQSGSDAGTSFKTFLLRLIPASDAAYGAMQDLGIITKDGANQFYDATGKMKPMAEVSEVLKKALTGLSDEQRNFYLNTIFGTDAMRAAAGIAEQGAVSFGKLQTTIENTDAAENARKRWDNSKGTLEQFKGVMDDVAISIGTSVKPAFEALFNALQPVVQAFGDFVRNHPTLSAWIIGLTLGFLGLVTALSAIVTIAPAIGAAWVVITGPIGWVIAAVLALIVAGVYLYNHWTEITTKLKALWEEYGAFLMALPIIGWIFQLIGAITFLWQNKEQIINWMVEKWTSFSLQLGIIIDAIKNRFEILKNGIQAVLSGINTAWNNTWNSVRDIFISIWESIKSTIKEGIDWIDAQIQRVTQSFANAKAMVGGAISSVSSGVSNAYSSVSNGVTSLFRASGGQVNPQSPYIVGENGPELFTPQGYGSISRAGSFGGNQIVINISGNSFMGREQIAEQIGAGLVDILKQNIKIA